MGIRAGQEHWEGMKHGFLIGSTGTLLASIIAIYAPIAILHKFNLTPNFSPIIIVTTIFLFITMFISGGLLGSLGGYLGVVIKKNQLKSPKKTKKLDVCLNKSKFGGYFLVRHNLA